MRAVTFQSMARMSSPARYSRTSTNSMPVPLNVERYSPTNVVLMILRVWSSIWRSCLRNSGDSMGRVRAAARGESAFRPSSLGLSAGRSWNFDRGEDLLDHVVGCQLFGFRLVREDDAVAQDVGRQLLDVLRDHEPAALEECHRPRRRGEVDGGAWRRPEADQGLE